MKQCDRRRFLFAVGAGAASVPLGSLTRSNRAFAQEAAEAVAEEAAEAVAEEAAEALPMLDPEDPVAVALEYVEVSPDPEQLCSGCVLYTDTTKLEEDDVGPCAVFPGKSVTAAGWCKSWVARA